MNDFFLSLGSNIEPEVNILQAIEELGRYGSVAAISTIWETAPIGSTDQPNYLNAVLHLQADISAQKFQDQVIPAIETLLKRVRGPDKYGPRTIDVDILLFNNEVLTLGHRKIPSREILERAFVAIPLAEIAPNLRHPINGEEMKTIANKFKMDKEAMVPRKDLIY
jgi:2-amino-4-hydroxy-6-hydroxymethyldihydropteridine diphosphokinase